jgi:hypothetical protein
LLTDLNANRLLELGAVSERCAELLSTRPRRTGLYSIRILAESLRALAASGVTSSGGPNKMVRAPFWNSYSPFLKCIAPAARFEGLEVNFFITIEPIMTVIRAVVTDLPMNQSAFMAFLSVLCFDKTESERVLFQRRSGRLQVRQGPRQKHVTLE